MSYLLDSLDVVYLKLFIVLTGIGDSSSDAWARDLIFCFLTMFFFGCPDISSCNLVIFILYFTVKTNDHKCLSKFDKIGIFIDMKFH